MNKKGEDSSINTIIIIVSVIVFLILAFWAVQKVLLKGGLS